MSRQQRAMPALTGLRFFLAIWVVVFHLTPANGTVTIPWLPSAPSAIHCLLRTGYVAVTIFFVLSGFVLAYNYDLSRPWTGASRWGFAGARFSRIYPAYFAGLVSLIPVAVYRAISGIPAGEYSASYGILNVLLLQSWFPSAALTWNYPGWSLSGEAFFYAVFPFAGLYLWKLRRPAALVCALIALWIASLAGPLIAMDAIPGFGDVQAAGGTGDLTMEPWSSLIAYHPLAGLPAFCAGIVLAALYRTIPENSPWFGRGDWLAVPAVAAVCGTLAYADALPFALVHNGLLLPLYAVLVLGLALGGGVLSRLLALSPLVFLGNASYAMYILHFPIAEWILLAGKYFGLTVLDSLKWAILYPLIVIATASAFYKFAEEPLHRRLRKRLSQSFKDRSGVLASR